MEDPVKGVFAWEFIAPCRIDADIRLIPTESSPDFSSTFAEGDGRTPAFPQQEMGPAKPSADHPNRESGSVGGLKAFPKRTFHNRKVIPQGRGEAVLFPCPVRPLPFEVFAGTGQGCIEDGSSSLNETHGLNG
jgi:hypothetical protein